MLIRLMISEDYDHVYALWKDTDGVGMRSFDDRKEGIDKFLARNPDTNFVAELGGDIVGVIMCGHDGRRAYIYHAATKQTHRKKGIGRKLVNAVIESMSNIGINKIALVVFADNAQGNAFWESMGFALREDLYYRDLSLNKDNV